MENITPATPAQAATPGKNELGQTPSAGTPPASGTQGNQQEGMVTIPAKDYAELTRNNARLKAFQKRAQFTSPKTATDPSSDGSDPEVIEELRKAKEEAQNLRNDLRIRDIRERTRELLDKPQYQSFPKTTKDLILKNPALLSKADNVEEAMIDVEEYLDTQVAGLNTQQPAQPGQNPAGGNSPSNPAGHETPPNVTAGNPAPVPTSNEEDVSKLTGSAKSRGMIRNLLKKK